MEKIGKLNVYAKNFTSQHGEDGILKYILEKAGDVPKLCVDVGAWDGKNLSNIYTFWHELGWTGVLLEADSSKCGNILKEYAGFKLHVFNTLVEIKGKNSLDEIFKANNISPEVGVLSIDIDSFDYYLWKYLEYVKPRIVIIEHNHTIPGYIDYHDPEGKLFLRCSAKSLEALGMDKGYKLICCTLTNSIFIKNELFDSRYMPDFPVEYLFDYSSCHPVQLSGFTNSNPFKFSNVIYGNPSRIQKYIGILKKFYNLILFRYKIPDVEVVENCRAAGINIL